MTNIFKRRIYRLCLGSATSFLLGVLMYGLVDTGTATFQYYWFAYILTFVGVILAFRALQEWCYWLEDGSEDANEEGSVSNPYPFTFYLEAGVLILIAVFLLAWTMLRSWPNAQEGVFLIWSLLVAGGCVLLGNLSMNLQ